MSVSARKWAKRQKTGGISTKAALLVLADYADGDGMCFPGVTTLAEDADTDERTMRRLLGRLADAGLITIEQRTGRSSVYRLAVETPGSHPGATPGPHPPGVAPPPPRGDTPDPPGSHPGDPGVTPPLTTTQPSSNRQGTNGSRARTSRSRELVSAADLDATAHSPTAHTIVSAWAAGRSLLTPQRRELMRAVDELLRQGAEPERVPAALDEAHGNPEWRSPARSLRYAYERAARPQQQSGPLAAATPIGTSSVRANAILALRKGDAS